MPQKVRHLSKVLFEKIKKQELDRGGERAERKRGERRGERG